MADEGVGVVFFGVGLAEAFFGVLAAAFFAGFAVLLALVAMDHSD
jgi:hypothetical protein